MLSSNCLFHLPATNDVEHGQKLVCTTQLSLFWFFEGLDFAVLVFIATQFQFYIKKPTSQNLIFVSLHLLPHSFIDDS